MAFHYPIGGGGGGGTIGGTINTNQVAFGTALDTIGGSNNLTWITGTNSLAGGNGSTAPGTTCFAFGSNNTVNGTACWALGVSNVTSMGSLRAGALGFAMTVNSSDSIGINLDGGTPQTLTQTNTFAVMGGKTGFQTVTPLSTVHINGSISYKHITTSVDYVVLLDDNYIGTVPVPPAPIIIDLPAAASAGTGKEYVIKDQIGGAGIGSSVTIRVPMGETIDGGASVILTTPYSSITVRSTGAAWAVI